MRPQMKLATKLICAFGLLIILQVGGNITAILLLGNINADVVELSTNWLPSIDAISDLDHEFQTLRRQEMLHGTIPPGSAYSGGMAAFCGFQ